MKDDCYLLRKGPPCFIQLGRYGDLILLMPAFKAIFDRTGYRPVVIVSFKYASVLEGASYVHPWVCGMEWWDGVPHARKLAQEKFSNVIVPQWWNDPENHDNLSEKALTTGGIVLQCHGREWGVNMGLWPNYMVSMWDRAGFTREEMMTLPLVFDRRNPEREHHTCSRFMNGTKPWLLYNFTGISSPFTHTPEVLRVMREFKNQFTFVDLGRIKATKIYDLLGLYDRAAAMITTDTATLHLAAAGNIPYLAYTVDGWTSSVPRGTICTEIKYSQAAQRLDDLRRYLKERLNDDSRLQQVRAAQSRVTASSSGGGGHLAFAGMAGARR